LKNASVGSTEGQGSKMKANYYKNIEVASQEAEVEIDYQLNDVSMLPHYIWRHNPIPRALTLPLLFLTTRLILMLNHIGGVGSIAWEKKLT